MMLKGDPSKGLLKAIIEVARAHGPDAAFYSIDITETLLRMNYWGLNPPKTPERTVNMYCSQRGDIFEHRGSDTYKLRANWR